MQFSEIQTEVMRNLGRGEQFINNDSDTTLAQVKVWINRGQRVVCEDRNWWFLLTATTQAITVVTESTSYSLPTRYKDALVIYIKETASTDTSTAILDCISEIDALRHYATDSDGEPESFVIRDTTYTLYPYADDSYTLYLSYYAFLADLSENTDTNTITNDFPDTVISLATSFGFAYMQEYSDSQYWENQYVKHLGQLRALDTKRKLAGEFSVRPRGDAWGTVKTRKGDRTYLVKENY